MGDTINTITLESLEQYIVTFSLENDSENLTEDKNNLSKPFIIFYFRNCSEGNNSKLEKRVLSYNKNAEEVNIICSQETYDTIHEMQSNENYYICNAMDEVKVVAKYIYEHYKDYSK